MIEQEVEVDSFFFKYALIYIDLLRDSDNCVTMLVTEIEADDNCSVTPSDAGTHELTEQLKKHWNLHWKSGNCLK